MLGLGVAAYFLVQYDFFNKQKNALDLISSDAIFVFETEEPIMAWNNLVTQPIWQRISEMPSLKNAEEQLVALDSLVGRSGNLDRSLKGNQMVISLHAVGRDEFDFLFSLSFKKDADEAFILDLEKNLPPLSRIVSRSYSDVPIFELQSPNLDRNLNYAKINNVLVASYTSFLVEEAIRYSQSEALPNFRDQYQELFNSLPSPKGLGVFRLTSQGISKLISGISRNSNLQMVQNFAENKIAANLELKFSENKIYLDGYTMFLDGQKVDFSDLGLSQNNVFSNYISNRTAVFLQYKGQENQSSDQIKNKGFQPRSTLKGDIEKELFEKGFLKNLKGDLGFLMLETVINEPQDKILLIPTDRTTEQIQLLKEFNLGLGKIDLSLIPVDFYQNLEIFMVSEDEFPAHLFEGKFLGFENTYITQMENLLVFANSSKAIKIFIDDVSSDNTWGKSLHQKRFIEGVSKDAWFNFVVNVPRFWNTVIEISSPTWQAFFQKYAPQLKSVDLMALSVKNNQMGHSVNLDLGYNLSPIKAVQDVVLKENKSVRFDNQLIYGPVSIQNFNDKSFEYVVQDELFNLHLLTSEGEIVFTESMDGPIISEIFQIDFFKNGKLQLLFATGGMVYVIDRLGSSVAGFPINPSNDRIAHLNLVDYSNTRDYRYFVATETGNLYLLDSKGNALEGWNPNKINGRMATKPAHHRIAGVGDQMIALGSNGYLHLYNRRGEAQVGSPIRLGSGLGSEYIVIERGSAKDTRIVTVTTEGEIVQVNFRGELAYRNQLLRPDRESKFNLVKDQNDDRYLYVVQQFNKVSVMDPEMKVLFTNEITASDYDFQFFSFGSDKNIFVVIDKTQEFIYLYNLEGKLLNTLPISGSNKIDLKYSGNQNQYTIHSIHGFYLSEYRLPI